MGTGAMVFLGLASFCLILLIWPLRQPVLPSAEDAPRQQEEFRQSSEKLKNIFTRNMSPDQRRQFEADLQAKREQREAQAKTDTARRDSVGSVLGWIVRAFALAGLILFAAIGGLACLPRAILYFRNRVQIGRTGERLAVVRPKLFGGEQVIEISRMAAGPARAMARRIRATVRSPGYVLWTVVLPGAPAGGPSLRFDVEHLDSGASLETPPARVQEFTAALNALRS